MTSAATDADADADAGELVTDGPAAGDAGVDMEAPDEADTADANGS